MMRFTNPFILLVAALGVIATVLTINPVLEKRQKQAAQARRAYHEAIFTTEVQLVNLLRGVSENTVLTQNLDWGLDHSVSKALEASLRQGELDEAALIDSNCGIIAKASVKDSVIRNCPLADIPMKKLEQFIWLKAGKSPTLGLILPFKIPGKGEMFLAGYVHLNQAWLELHPSLNARFEHLSLSIMSDSKNENATILLREGLDHKGRGLANLASTDLMFKLFPRTLVSKPIVNDSLLWYNLIIAIVLSVLAWWQEKWKRSQVGKDRASLVEAVQALLQKNDAECANLHDLDLKNLANLCEPINASFEKLHEKNRVLRKDLLAQKEIIKERDFALANKSQKMDTMAAYESLAAQIKETSQSFFDNISTNQSMAEDIADLLVHGLNRNAQSISGFMDHWAKEIEERGSRRFFRALSETPGNTLETFLDEQLQTLSTLSQDLSTQSVNATMQAQKLVTSLREAGKISEHWQGLTFSDDTSVKGSSMIDMVLEAQKLLKQRSSDNSARFLNPFDLSSVKHLPKAPKASFVSALYHIYLSMVMTARNSAIVEFEIQNHIKTSDKRMSFVISLEAMNKDASNFKVSEDAQKNFVIASRLLSIHDLHCQKLPGFDESVVVAISWEKTLSPTKRPVSSRHMTNGATLS